MVIVLLFIYQSVITIDKPTAQESFKLELIREVRLDNEFYNRSYTGIAPNGFLIVVDNGNKKVKIINKKNEVVRVFGEEGNGPGEFFGPHKIKTSKEAFYINDVQSQHVYDYNFKLIKEIVRKNDYAVVFPDKFVMLNTSSDNIYERSFSLSGDHIADRRIKISLYDNKLLSSTPSFAKKPRNHIYTPIGIVANYFGDYAIEVRDFNYKSKAIIRKNTERVYNKPRVTVHGQPVDKSQKKELAKLLNKRTQSSATHSNIGFCDYGFVIRTASGTSKHLKFDLISYDLKYLAELELKFTDRVNSAQIHQNKLVIDLLSDEIGPYIQIYDFIKND